MKDLLIRENNIVKRKQNEIKEEDKNYQELMNIYCVALNKVKDIMEKIQTKANLYSGYDVITNITSRIKSYNSIIKKMKKKHIDLTYESLIENVNDIAGLRVICLSEKDIYKIVNIISKLEDINVIKEKDYIRKHKKSGYSAYHVILEVPIYIEQKQVWVKVEIQLRTIGMDLWSVLEHRINYKSSQKVSKKNKGKLKLYAHIISKITKDMSKMYQNAYQYIES